MLVPLDDDYDDKMILFVVTLAKVKVSFLVRRQFRLDY